MFIDKELAFVLNFGVSNDPKYPSVAEMLNKWEERHPNNSQSIDSLIVSKKIDTEAFLWVLNRVSLQTISQYNWTSLIDGWDKFVEKDATTLNKVVSTLNLILDKCIVLKQNNDTASANPFVSIVSHIIKKAQHQSCYKSMTDENKENVFQLMTKAFQSGLIKGRDFKVLSGPMLEDFGLFNATSSFGIDHSIVVKGIAFNRGTSKIAFSENNILLNVLNKIALTSPDAVFDIKWQPDDIVGLGPAVVKLVQTIDQSQLSEAQKKSLWPQLEEDKRSQKEFPFDLVRSVCSIPYNQYSYWSYLRHPEMLFHPTFLGGCMFKQKHVFLQNDSKIVFVSRLALVCVWFWPLLVFSPTKIQKSRPALLSRHVDSVDATYVAA